jgi:hypothetical protein
VCNHQSPDYPWIIVWQNGNIDIYTDDGSLYDGEASGYDLVEHLPDCTSYAWEPKPKMQLKEGAWYKNAHGHVVGPCKPSTDRNDRPWIVDGIYYQDDGTNTLAGCHLVEEVPDPTPKPVYRSFHSAAEFAPYRCRWVIPKKYSIPMGLAFLCYSYSDEGIYTKNGTIGWASMLRDFQFEDGTPFGVKVS